jgi:orotate phosphoribosyltransferase
MSNVQAPVITRVRQELTDYLTARDAFWQWNGHKHVAQLASGKFSDFFANLTPLYENPILQNKVVWALCALFFEPGLRNAGNNLWVVGPSMGAVGLLQSVALEGHAWKRDIRCAYTEKVQHAFLNPPAGGPAGEETMELKRFNLGPDPYVILVEDVVTTCGSMNKTEEAVKAQALQNQTVAMIVGRMAVVDRRVGECDPSITCLIRVEPRTWDRLEDMPPEMRACTPVRPKTSWKELTTEMLEGVKPCS